MKRSRILRVVRQALLAAAAVTVASARFADGRSRRVGGPPEELSCQELCERDTGLDADTCRTECAVWTDTAMNTTEALDDFVEDEVTNEQGGQEMEQYAERHGLNISDCEPTVDILEEPTFADLDADGSGGISEDEAVAWGNAACVPDELVRQMVHETDANGDGELDSEEFNHGGEDTQLEVRIDEALDNRTQGDDEVNTAQVPDFDAFDLDGDGVLSEQELARTFGLEMQRRDPEATENDMEELDAEVRETFEWLDTDGDGVLSKTEFYMDAPENELSDELQEQAASDEDAGDPDDRHQAAALL